MNNELTTVAEEALDELRGRFLTFYIDDTFYSIELCHIIEIISIQPTTYGSRACRITSRALSTSGAR